MTVTASLTSVYVESDFTLLVWAIELCSVVQEVPQRRNTLLKVSKFYIQNGT